MMTNHGFECELYLLVIRSGVCSCTNMRRFWIVADVNDGTSLESHIHTISSPIHIQWIRSKLHDSCAPGQSNPQSSLPSRTFKPETHAQHGSDIIHTEWHSQRDKRTFLIRATEGRNYIWPPSGEVEEINDKCHYRWKKHKIWPWPTPCTASQSWKHKPDVILDSICVNITLKRTSCVVRPDDLEKSYDEVTVNMIIAVVQAIGFSNSFNNPIVYAFMNENFKKNCVATLSLYLRRPVRQGGTRERANVSVHFSKHLKTEAFSTNTSAGPHTPHNRHLETSTRSSQLPMSASAVK